MEVPSSKVLERLIGIPKHEQFISTITVSDIVYGAVKSGRPDYRLSNLENVLLPSVNVVGFKQMENGGTIFKTLPHSVLNCRVIPSDLLS